MGAAAGSRLPAAGFRLSNPQSRLSAIGSRLLRGGADALISEILNFLR
jgi:hypothetical protein